MSQFHLCLTDELLRPRETHRGEGTRLLEQEPGPEAVYA